MKGDDGEDGKAVEEMGKEILLRPDSKTENELKINGKKIIAEIRGTKLKEKEKVETSRAGFIIFFIFIQCFSSSKYKNFSSHLLFLFMMVSLSG